jgi:hypothetical protein
VALECARLVRLLTLSAPIVPRAATVTQLNTTSNSTGVIDYAFSMTHNSTASSVLGPPVPTGQVYESFEFYWAQTTFTLYGPPANLHCIEAPLPG